MNFYNPYMMFPYGNMAMSPARPGLFAGLMGGIRRINWSGLLNNTQRTLGVINQAIPVVRQMTPVMKNARTMFRVMNEFKKVDEVPKTNNAPTTIAQKQPQYTPIHQTNTPTFFV